ncbi:MAG TPA: lipid-binding SYLF domain-containing protein [Terriglobales bacterium]|nr:lipid-binding SYLF domain-containing protein [Terriglobales bacterium]
MKFNRSAVGKCLIVASAFMLVFATLGWAANDDKESSKDQSDIVKRIDKAGDVLTEIMGTPDKAIPDKVLSDARCIAIIPSMVKIAVGFGGSHGKGVAVCRTNRGWSAPAPVTITGGSWGLQLGGQAIDLVLLVMNQKGMDSLLSSKFKLGADASAAAGPVGRDAGADTDWKMKAEVLSYSRARGLFAGIDLNGSALTQDKDETRVLYGGKFYPFKDILAGNVKAPADTHQFLATVAKYAPNTPGQARNESERTTTTTASKH